MSADDLNEDGLNEKLSVGWWLWFTDAITVFVRGVLSGLFPGLAGGIGGVALTDTTNVTTMATNGAWGFAFLMCVKGLERFHLWVTRPENEMPNPLRALKASPDPTPMVPMKDADRVLPTVGPDPFAKIPELGPQPTIK